MTRILRGDIFWADLNPVRSDKQGRMRPVVVVSQDIFNERSGTIIAMSVTSRPQRTGFPLALELTEAGLSKQSWVKISQVRTISTERMGEKIGHVSVEILKQLIEGLNEIVGE